MRKRSILIRETEPGWTAAELAEDQDFLDNLQVALLLALQAEGELQPHQVEQCLAWLREEKA